MTHDESVRPDIKLSRLKRLKPLLPNGTVTVGNCCLKHDGAALVVVMSQEKHVRLV